MGTLLSIKLSEFQFDAKYQGEEFLYKPKKSAHNLT